MERQAGLASRSCSELSLSGPSVMDCSLQIQTEISPLLPLSCFWSQRFIPVTGTEQEHSPCMGSQLLGTWEVGLVVWPFQPCTWEAGRSLCLRGQPGLHGVPGTARAISKTRGEQAYQGIITGGSGRKLSLY